MKRVVNRRWRMLIAVIASAGLAGPGCARSDAQKARKSHAEHDHKQPTDTHEEHAPHEHEHAHSSEHSSDSTLIVSTRPKPAKSGEPTTLKLMIHEADGRMLSDFELVHEKKIHLIIVREGLDIFDHIHPKVDESGHITATHVFPVGGTYRLFADFKPHGKAQTTASASVNVAGDSPTAEPLKVNVPGNVTVNELQAEVSITPEPDNSAVVSFELRDKEGTAITDLEPYLGAMGHLVVVSADGQRYVHAHPMHDGDSAAPIVSFEAHFPKPGLYKGWGQFQKDGAVFTIPFVVELKEE